MAAHCEDAVPYGNLISVIKFGPLSIPTIHKAIRVAEDKII